MRMIRTDLAMEAHACWKESAGETSELKGVIAREETLRGFPLTRVEIVDNEGAAALQKPQGTYLTLDVSRCQGPEGLQEAAGAVAELLEPLLPEEGPTLVAGLGNPAMTPDALGPRCMDHLLITRHLKNVLPQLRETAALSGGVLGTTGLEAAEWVQGVAEHMKPAAVIVVDALAARSLDRLCQSIQISDTGLVPGSGVGNHRMALNRETLGVPVVSVGVPTVVSLETIIHDLTGDCGYLPQKGFFLTPDAIDEKIKKLSKMIAYGINLALQPGLTVTDLDALLV